MIALMILSSGAMATYVSSADVYAAETTEAVQNVKIKVATDEDTAIATWGKVDNAVYTVSLDGVVVSDKQSDTSFRFTGLDKGSYKVSVDAYDEKGTLIAAGTASFTSAKRIAAVSKIDACAGYGSVSLYWSPVSDADKYIVCYGATKDRADIDNKVAYRIEVTNNLKYTAKTWTYQIMGLTKVVAPWDKAKKQKAFKLRIKNPGKGKNFYFRGYAVKKENGKQYISTDSAIDNASRVEYIKYKFTLKTIKKLKSHDGKNKSYTFRKGQTLTASGFGGGKYKFYYKINGKEYYFYCNAISAKGASAIYNKTMDYSRTEAENYVNEKGFKSPTKYLIWASLYTQHTYIFSGSKGKWTCIRDFDVGSGTAREASPSGETKELIAGPGTEKKPGKKYSRKGHGRRYYWNPYSSWNSFHSVKMSKDGEPLQTLGYPASKGCIRCPLADAKYIFSLPRHSKVVVL